MLLKSLLFALSLGLAQGALAQGAPGADLSGGKNPERGWFFFEDPPKPVEPPARAPAPEPRKAEPPRKTAEKPRDCTRPEQWTPACGFVDPGENFEFQAKQRDALLERMSMSNNDPKAVEAFQYYIKWVMERATQVANLWQYNLTQNPLLDATVNQPVSSFGLRLMTEVRDGRAQEIYSALKSDGAFFVYFTRNDCVFCHQMAPHIRRLGENTGLPIRNAALDDTCMAGLEEGCEKGAAVQAPAQALQVSIVPTVFLYVPAGNVWLRIATGLTDLQTMSARTVSFFSAYRNALLKGVANGSAGRAPVDFSDTAPTGTAPGLSSSGPARMPTEDEMARLLGSKSK